MIKSAIQLKAKIRNVSDGDDKVAKAMLRIFLWKGSLREYQYLRIEIILFLKVEC